MAYASGALAQDATLQRIADALDGGSNIIAPRESGLVASNAYAIGDQFILGGKLYKATATIAIGDTIVTEGVGANCTESDSITEQVGDTANSKVTFTSSDNDATTEKTSDGFTSVATMTSGETHAGLFQKISKMFLNIRKLWNTVGSTPLENGQTLTSIVSGGLTANNAGAHNAVYRGKSLGSSVTSAQYAEIDAGTFKDLYIGDYWTINGVNYRIAAFDYWLHCGDTECTDHHVVIVPDTVLDTKAMNDSNVTTGGYVGSKMYTTYMATAKSTIQTAFGSANILSHRELFTNAVSSDKASGWAWYDSTIDLMNESMVYGHEAWASYPQYETAIDKGQLPLFSLDPSKIIAFNNGTRAYWWLRDVVSGADFAFANHDGNASNSYASDSLCIRPAFAIYKP